METRQERREARRRNARKMRVSGKSVFLLLDLERDGLRREARARRNRGSRKRNADWLGR